MSAPVQAGEILAGKYRVETVLGVGGMGVVVAATHLQLGERVALKFLLADASRRPEIVARFLREAQAAVRIRSEHVARITDVGTLPNGAPYMVMEYLAGRDLAQVVEGQGALSTEHAVDYVLQACEAIAEAHSLGIVHRDLKPANLFLTRRADGSHLVKVLDFGISKAAAAGPQASDPSLTATHAGMMGSPLYMSPEQLRSAKKVDARADVWSLGIILHQLVTGSTPFIAETISGLIAAIIADVPKPLRVALPSASPVLESVILRCLEKDLDRRFQSVAELADALLPIAPARSRQSVERISRVIRPDSIAMMDGLADTDRALPPVVGDGTMDPVSATAPPFSPSAARAIQATSQQTSAATRASAELPASRKSSRVGLGALAAVAAVALVGGGLMLGLRSAATAASGSPAAATQAAGETPVPSEPSKPVSRPDSSPASLPVVSIADLPGAPTSSVSARHAQDAGPRPLVTPSAAQPNALPPKPAGGGTSVLPRGAF